MIRPDAAIINFTYDLLPLMLQEASVTKGAIIDNKFGGY